MSHTRAANTSELRQNTGIQEFRYSFAELKIVPAELEVLLGFHPGISPDPFPDYIASALAEASGLFDIRAGFRKVSPVSFLQIPRQFVVEGRIFTPGRIVFSKIRKSNEIAFFAGTAGGAVSDRCCCLNDAGEAIYSYVLDVLGSVVAGKAVEKMMDWLEREVNTEGNHISESFSPGYCDWDVAEQQKIFSLFPQNFCGITLSSSSLMIPVKSVSGIIGIGPLLNRKYYQCRYCNNKTCSFRKPLRIVKHDVY